MFIFYIIFTILCSLFTYKFALHQFIKTEKITDKGFETHNKYICKALDEIAQIKTDVNKIKKDIYQ